MTNLLAEHYKQSISDLNYQIVALNFNSVTIQDFLNQTILRAIRNVGHKLKQSTNSNKLSSKFPRATIQQHPQTFLKTFPVYGKQTNHLQTHPTHIHPQTFLKTFPVYGIQTHHLETETTHIQIVSDSPRGPI